jgi:hypothetical protein
MSLVRVAYLRDLLSCMRCPICLRGYTAAHVPFLLSPCGHTVCEATKERLTRCPICRTDIDTATKNRELLSVLVTAQTAFTPNEENHFLSALRENCAVLESIESKQMHWKPEQVQAVGQLVTAMKRHSEDVGKDWIEATGLSHFVVTVLHRKLLVLKHILRHRVRLGWENPEHDLPMVI